MSGFDERLILRYKWWDLMQFLGLIPVRFAKMEFCFDSVNLIITACPYSNFVLIFMSFNKEEIL